MSWVSEELRDVDLGDERRNRRLVQIVEDLAAQPNASVPQAMRDEAAVQGVYDFWSNRRVQPEEIVAAHARRTVERMAEHATILAIQDTTELDYSTHRSTVGLGPISNPKARGLKVHTVLAATAEGVPLGVLHQTVWARPSNRAIAKHRNIEEKESHRWLESLELTQNLMPPETKVVTIADREGDIYELFALPRSQNSEFLIRAAQNRNTKANPMIAEMQPLFAAIRQVPVQGQFRLELHRTPRRAARLATLSVRYTQLWLQPPAEKQSMSAICVDVILAQEESPPTGETPVNWLLVTTLSIGDFAAARQCLDWYASRWIIERFHYTIKSGCRLESLQLQRSDRLHRALATYLIVAWRLLWLTYEARQHPDQSVAGILSDAEWRSLYCTVHQTIVPPVQPPSLAECIEWIAQLGGYVEGGDDRDPGVKVLWRGLQRLHDITATWQLLHPKSSDCSQTGSILIEIGLDSDTTLSSCSTS
ncbi:MAG: IS4 family transposase [Leptolyngbya sp. Prado105]|jgi:hypothetical protein|nr:IS4 family transposase [Leptolyngbya sp. Prado105]